MTPDVKLSPCPFCRAVPVRIDEQRAKIDHAADCYMRRYIGSGQLWMLADAERWNRRPTAQGQAQEGEKSPLSQESLRDADWILAMSAAAKAVGYNGNVPIVAQPHVIEQWLRAITASQRKECEACGGNGFTDETHGNVQFKTSEFYPRCEACNGTGQRKETP